MALICWAITGIIVGLLARLLFRGRPGGLLPTLMLPVIGALVGGYISLYFQGGLLSEPTPGNLLSALLVALLMLIVVRILRF